MRHVWVSRNRKDDRYLPQQNGDDLLKPDVRPDRQGSEKGHDG